MQHQLGLTYTGSVTIMEMSSHVVVHGSLVMFTFLIRLNPYYIAIKTMLLYYGFCLASDYTSLNSFLRRAVKLGYYDTQSATARDLFCDADDALFHKILYNKAHLLHVYLPDRSQIVYTLHNRSHNKMLMPKTSDLNERHFLIRVLYKHCY